ncbi:SAG1386/EF1546 family surface-associated protein [Streptococcus massiliensis]|uniref:30S ribosomal protein S15 n=1 Tax=Streptococcus massiliensis TaxID=313439 RepID=A0A380KYM6_9STRE|nr:SAG1386/EF1546 family surface-associated protein [Streptococcus massiliensis]SUN75670.1 30S ribosomal protein S15 [Streptococcus massiliensis]
MAKEPWEENVYDKGEETLRRSKKSVDAWANRILTILAVIFFIVVIVIVATMFYLSTGGSNEKKATEGFHSSGAAVSTVSSAPAISQTETSETESSQSSGPGTITVQAGEGEASIAARAGISIAQLEQLNPQHMTQGYWYANPGDVVKIQ